MRRAVERSFTFQRLTRTLPAPAARNARESPINPSPASSRPRPVSQAERVTWAATSLIRPMSPTVMRLGAKAPESGASHKPERSGSASFTSPWVAR